MSGTSCIGRIAGREGDWYAELDFEAAEAAIIERGPGGTKVGPIATVPLGAILDADEDNGPDLDPDDARNADLCKIVFAPEAWATLASIKSDIERRFNTNGEGVSMPPWAEAIVDQIDRTLECLTVPGRGE